MQIKLSNTCEKKSLTPGYLSFFVQEIIHGVWWLWRDSCGWREQPAVPPGRGPVHLPPEPALHACAGQTARRGAAPARLRAHLLPQRRTRRRKRRQRLDVFLNPTEWKKKAWSVVNAFALQGNVITSFVFLAWECSSVQILHRWQTEKLLLVVDIVAAVVTLMLLSEKCIKFTEPWNTCWETGSNTPVEMHLVRRTLDTRLEGSPTNCSHAFLCCHVVHPSSNGSYIQQWLFSQERSSLEQQKTDNRISVANKEKDLPMLPKNERATPAEMEKTSTSLRCSPRNAHIAVVVMKAKREMGGGKCVKRKPWSEKDLESVEISGWYDDISPEKVP